MCSTLERRRHPRVTAAVPLALRSASDDRLVDATSVNLPLGGLPAVPTRPSASHGCLSVVVAERDRLIVANAEGDVARPTACPAPIVHLVLLVLPVDVTPKFHRDRFLTAALVGGFNVLDRSS